MASPTPRQLDILRLSAFGLTEREIAVKLGIALTTVRNHKAMLRDRIGIRTMAEAVRLGMEEGWLR